MKQMKKYAAILVVSLFVGLFAAACQAGPKAAPAALRVGALKGPTAMGLVKLMQADEGAQRYAFTLAASPDALVPALVRGDLDLACLPVNVAAVLFANTNGEIKVTNINTLGILDILARGDTITRLSDLRGRTVYASGKASTPEYVLRHLLRAAGVEDVNVVWKAEHAEALAAFLADEQGLALLPQPFATIAQSKGNDIRVALDLNRLWTEQFGSALITGVTVARRQVLDEQAAAVRQFLADYEASVEFVNAHVAEAAALIGKYEIFAADVAEKALPLCNIAFVKGTAMKAELMPFYAMLFEQDAAATGGRLPDEDFYYTAD